MYKIAYISYHSIDADTGVGKKILEQIGQWKNQGNEVKAFSFSSIIDIPRQEKDGVVHYKSKCLLYKRFVVTPSLVRDLESYCPDIVYFRHDLFSSNYKYISENFFTVVEVQTDELSETLALAIQNRSLKYFIAYIYALCTRDLLFSRARGIVVVTNELSHSRRFLKYNKPTVTIPNGILLSDHCCLKQCNEGRIQLFFIGTPGCLWHGTDIIIKIAKVLHDFDFHIVGIEGNNLNNVFYYGYLKYDIYNEIMKKCHICIGSLALFRINMNEASPLKVREYLAYGFPTIVGFNDTSFINSSCDFLLRVDFYQESFMANVRKIYEFCIQNKMRVVGHAEIDQIDSFLLESRRTAFLHSLFSQGF